MVDVRDFLVELGTEELPPKALPKLIQAFEQGVVDGLNKAGLSFGEVKSYAAPRRLAIWIKAVPTAQPDQAIERRGPALKAAFDEAGNPTKTALGFAQSCGVDVTELQRLETDKGAWLVYRVQQQGQATTALLPNIVSASLAALPIPKRMRWGATEHQFVRPVHWLVMLFGDDVVDAEILGIKSGAESRGHRFHHPSSIRIASPSSYAAQLKEGKVQVDFAERREEIARQVRLQAKELGGEPVIEPGLLDEVTALVEWPVAVAGSFDREFLEVPAEALISTMQEHQRYFALKDTAGALMPNFITVANIESKDVSQIRSGNERVIRPRFTDARFFWLQDRKSALVDRLDTLKNIVFQNKIGTVFDKAERVAVLAKAIAQMIGADGDQAERAARLAKCDLVTQMVGEFPELQGIMGRYCALADGEPAAVANAVEQHYWPRFAGDALPQDGVAQAVALADRLDTLVGIFAIGQAPTGDKDPFALRRASIGVLRILIECRLAISLRDCLTKAAEAYPATLAAGNSISAVNDFISERLRAYYADQGVRPDLFEAVRAVSPVQPLDFDRRVQACRDFIALPEAPSLAAANKRVSNILKKTELAGESVVRSELLADPAERALAERLTAIRAETVEVLKRSDYRALLLILATLRGPVDAFFEGVMVMADDAAVRENRLALLKSMREMFLEVADFSCLQG